MASYAAACTGGGNVVINNASQIGASKLGVAYSGTTHWGMVLNDTVAQAGSVLIQFMSNGTGIGSITNNGNTATAYNTSSDRRIKDNIATTTLGLDTLMQLPVREFSFKSDSTHAQTTGFIAQELYEVFPWAVTTNGDNGIDPLGASSTPWSVDYGRITPLLAKSIQDLNLKLEDLATATSEIADGTFTSRFFASLFTRLTQWFASATNGIGDFFARVGNFGRVNTNELCIDDVCITRGEFLRMKAGQSTGASTALPAANDNPQPQEQSSDDSNEPDSVAEETDDTLLVDEPPQDDTAESEPASVPVVSEVANDNEPQHLQAAI